MTSTLHGRLSASCLAVAAALLLLGPADAAATDEAPSPGPGQGDGLEQRIDADQQVAQGEAVLATGHADLGPRYVDGEWNLLVHDDTSVAGSVWRHLDDTVLRVADAAVRDVPDDPAYAFLGVEPGTPVHVLPQTQDADVVWLGWNTQSPEVIDRVDRGVTLSMVDARGPGEVVVYLQDGGFGRPDVLWDSRDGGEQPLWVEVNTHTHANWVFTEPGVYLVAVRASATLVDGTEETTTGTLRVAVGDATPEGEALAAPALAGTESVAGAPDDGAATDATGAGSGGEAEDESAGGSPAVVVLAVGAALLVAGLAVVLVRTRRARVRALAGGER